MIGRIWCIGWIGVHEEHELDVTTGEKTVDVIVLERVYLLEISTARLVR